MSVCTMQNSTKVLKPMSSAEFQHLSEYIFDHCGIKMSPVKKPILEGRLQKRLRSLGIGSYKEYCDYLFHSPERETERVHMIDCVTTNKTDFFREPVHFRFLTDTLLPEFVSASGSECHKIKVWSAACSSGEEPYTLAMVLSDFACQFPGVQFEIIATDISTRVLEKARLGIYEESQVAVVPLCMRQKYLLRGKDRGKQLVRITPKVRARVQFQRANLMDEHIMPLDSLDVIFCRNVIIYFDRQTQYKLLERLSHCLKPGGYLFLGHSETVHGFALPFSRVTSTIYRKEF
jgi:chemotaxis protein methyltransferase CheR